MTVQEFALLMIATALYLLVGTGAALFGISGKIIGVILGLCTAAVILSKMKQIKYKLTYGNALRLGLGLALPYLIVLGKPYLFQIAKNFLATLGLGLSFWFLSKTAENKEKIREVLQDIYLNEQREENHEEPV